MTESTTTTASATLRTCRCGHDRNHHAIDPRRTFGFWGWILLFAGASATPKRVTFWCRECAETVETSRDPDVLRRYRQ